MNDEKRPLQSNWTCSFVWKRRLAVDRPVGGQHMHPSGVQFGLSRGLLIESISTAAESRPVLIKALAECVGVLL